MILSTGTRLPPRSTGRPAGGCWIGDSRHVSYVVRARSRERRESGIALSATILSLRDPLRFTSSASFVITNRFSIRLHSSVRALEMRSFYHQLFQSICYLLFFYCSNNHLPCPLDRFVNLSCWRLLITYCLAAQIRRCSFALSFTPITIYTYICSPTSWVRKTRSPCIHVQPSKFMNVSPSPYPSYVIILNWLPLR